MRSRRRYARRLNADWLNKDFLRRPTLYDARRGGTPRLKQAVFSVVANTGLICLGTGAVLLVPAFATDAYFWLPAAAAAQIWMCCIRRAGN